MPVTKDEIVDTIRTARKRVEDIVSSAPEAAWSNPVYDQGWNAKQILCHLALTAGVPSLLIALAKTSRPAAPPQAAGSGIDIDGLNERMVASRLEKPVVEVLDELRGNYERAIKDVMDASDDLLVQPLQTPWGTRAALGELILVEDLRDHVMVHIRDLAQAVGSSAGAE